MLKHIHISNSTQINLTQNFNNILESDASIIHNSEACKSGVVYDSRLKLLSWTFLLWHVVYNEVQ